MKSILAPPGQSSNWLFLLVLTLGWSSALAQEKRTVRVTNFPTLERACTEAQAGDEIVLAPGVYRFQGKSRIHIASRPGPVTVRGETGQRDDVIVEGFGQDDQTVQVIFELTDSPAWTFQDLTTRQTYFHGFKLNRGSVDCVLRNVVMRDHGESGVKGTCEPGNDLHPDRLLVEGCDIGFTQPTGGTRDVVEGIDGVAVEGWTIRRNRFLHIQRAGQPAYGAFTKGNSLHTVLEENTFEHCFIGASLGGGGTGAAFFRAGDRTYEERGGLIRHNTFHACTDAAIYLNKAHDCRIEDNQMEACGANIDLRYPATTAYLHGNTATPDTKPLVRCRDGATQLPEPPAASREASASVPS